MRDKQVMSPPGGRNSRLFWSSLDYIGSLGF